MNDEIDINSYRTPYNIDIDRLSGFKFDGYISKVSELPSKIKTVLTDFSTAEFVEEKLGLQFNLSGLQKAETTRIIRDIILNDLNISDMVNTIASKLQIAPQMAKDVTNQIISQLFVPVMEEIKQIQRQKFEDQLQTVNSSRQPESQPEVEPQNLEVQPQNTTPQPTSPSNQSFHEQNMSQKDIMETGGNVLDLRQR